MHATEVEYVTDQQRYILNHKLYLVIQIWILIAQVN